MLIKPGRSRGGIGKCKLALSVLGCRYIHLSLFTMALCPVAAYWVGISDLMRNNYLAGVCTNWDDLLKTTRQKYQNRAEEINIKRALYMEQSYAIYRCYTITVCRCKVEARLVTYRQNHSNVSKCRLCMYHTL